MGANGSGRNSNKARELLTGASSIYAATVATVVLQFGYAAFTTRVVGAEDFGLYAIATASAVLLGSIAAGPLVASAGRMQHVGGPGLRALWRLGVVVASVAAALMFLTAPVWAWIWGAPDALPVLRLIALSVFVGPLSALAGALMRRVGSFRVLAIGTVIANAVGMAVGVLAVAYFHNAISLVVSALIGQILAGIAFAWMIRRYFAHGGPPARARDFISYGTTIGMSRLLGFVNGFLGKFAVSHGVGVSALGVWNRAEVVSSVPTQQLQSAIIQAVYPEFRHDVGSPTRARRVWPDLLGLVAWTLWPPMAYAAVAMFGVLPLLFGPGWEAAEPIAAVLVLSGALQLSTMVLSSAVEALGRRRWILIQQLSVLAVQVFGAVATVRIGSLWPVLVAVPVSMVVQHGIDLRMARAAGYVGLRPVARYYCGAATAAAAAAALAVVTLMATEQLGPLLRTASFGVVFVSLIAIAWAARSRLVPYRLYMQYGGRPAGAVARREADSS